MNKQKFLTTKNVFLITAAIILTSGFFVATPALAATTSNITTNAVANLAPATAKQGTVKVQIMTFRFTPTAADTFKSMEVRYIGSTIADIGNAYLYQESGAVPGTFNPATDTLRDATGIGADTNLNPTDFALAAGTAVQFYVVADIDSGATIGNTVDFQVRADEIIFNSGTWPSTADIVANGWNPAGSSTIVDNITTDEVAQVGPVSTLQGASKLPILSFTLSNTDSTDKFKSVKVRWTGTATSPNTDIGNVYLYQESGAISGSTFNSASDTLKDTTGAGSGTEITLDPDGVDFAFDPQAKFYIVADIKADAVLGHHIDFKIEAVKIDLTHENWPPASEVTAGIWNPAGDTVIIPPTATLTVTKIVMNDNGGTKVVSNFPLFIDGMSVTSGVASTTSQGLHTISETNQSGYAGTIGGDCAANGTITLVAGNSYNCTITNDDQPGTLIVKKILINDNGGTVATSSFSFQVNGGDPVAFEQDGQNDLTVNAGTYSITEPAVNGYATTYNNCTNVVVSNGGSATCTITNNDEPAKLTIIKNTTGDDGTFNFMVTNNNSTVVAEPIITTHDGTGQAIPTEMLALNLTAGHYTVSEAPQTSWDLNNASCELQDNSGGGNFITNTALPASSADFTADIGELWTCTFTNTKRGSITVHKNVVAPDGATDVSDSHNFTIHRDNSETGDTVSETVTKIYGNLAPGTYTITEDIDSNYSFVSFSQDTNNNLAGAQVVVTAGQNTDITITNEQKPAHLTVIKHVNNPNGGKAVAADFIMDVNGTKFPGNDTEGITVTVTVNPGIFSVSETGPIGYSRYSADGKCSGNLASNETASCTITNSDIQLGNGAITIIKQVINDNGGTATADAFKIRVEDENEEGVENSPSNGSETGTLYILEAGASYTISEDDPTAQGYAQTGISCQPIIGGEPLTGKTVTIDLADQQAYICTITNNDIAPQLTLVKQIDNGQGIGTSTPSQWTLSAQGPTDISGASGSDTVTNANVNIGTYTLSESGGPKGYTQGGWNCTGVENNGDSITLGLGQAATCTITNTAQPAVLTIVKKTDQVSGNGAFNFKITGTGDSEFSRSLSLQTDGGIATSSDIELPAGDFNVNEVDLAEGWRLAEVACVYDNRSIGQAIAGGERITVGNGDHITCTFTNTRTVITGEESIIKTSTTAGDMIIDIPAATTVTGPINWNGIIIPPTATTTFAAPTPDSGFDSATPVIAIEVGAGDTPLTFDKAVKITFTGQAGKYVGWSRGGIFTKITTVCDSPTNPTLAPGADCKIDIGGDLVVWTKHFTVFVAYTQTATPPAASASVASTGGAVALSPSNAYANWLAQQPAAPAPAPAAATPQVLGVKIFADGSLIKFNNKIYIIINGKRTVIKNLWELAKYKGQKINVVDAETLNQYPEVLGDKTYPDNTIIKNGDKLYIIKNGQKQYIKNLKELKAYIKLYKITKLY